MINWRMMRDDWYMICDDWYTMRDDWYMIVMICICMTNGRVIHDDFNIFKHDDSFANLTDSKMHMLSPT